MHRVFISYHHANDQDYKNELVRLGEAHDLFIDKSVDVGEIDPDLPNQKIRTIIRDKYLRDTTVTIVLVGTETRYRMHCDWELKSSMINGSLNKKSGILVIQLPDADNGYFTAAHEIEKKSFYPDITGWIAIDTEAEYKRRCPYMPQRIIDNLLKNTAKISVTNWNTIANNPDALEIMISNANKSRASNEYCLKLPMRRRSHSQGFGGVKLFRN